MGKRNVEHGAEAGFQALYSAGHGEQHPNGCFVPRQPSLQSDVERWLAADYDTVVRVLGTHEYLQIELEGLLAPPEASTNMVKTAYLPSLDGEVWRTDRLLGDQRSELFGDPTELPADSCCHEIKRFHESDVTQPPVSDFSPELGEGQPRPYFLQKRHTPQRCVDHSLDQNGADILARRGRGEGQGFTPVPRTTAPLERARASISRVNLGCRTEGKTISSQVLTTFALASRQSLI